LRVVFSQTKKFTVIAFSDVNMYATSMTQRNVLKAALKGAKQSARPCCPLQKLLLIKKVYHLNTLHLYPAQTRKRTKKE